MAETDPNINGQELEPTHASSVGQFALLGANVGQTLAPSSAIGEENAEAVHLKQVFAPIPVDQSDERLVQYVQTHKDGQHEVNRLFNNPDSFTTAESRLTAAKRVTDLAARDEAFSVLIEAHCGKQVQPAQIVEMIRYDAPLRLSVGTLMVLKVNEYIEEHPERIPARVLSGDMKNPGKSPMKIFLPEKMPTKEYSALLAVSMLDGSWDDAKVGVSDRMEFDTNGVATNGQHEAMARLTLGTGGFTGETNIDENIGDGWHSFIQSLGVPSMKSPELTVFDDGTLSIADQCKRLDMYLASAKNIYSTYANSGGRTFRSFMGLPSDGPDLAAFRGAILWGQGNEVVDSDLGRSQLHRLVTELFSENGLVPNTAHEVPGLVGDIVGFDVAENEYNGVNPSRLQRWLGAKIPPAFMQGIQAIRRVGRAEIGDRTESLDDGTQLNTVGTFDVVSGVVSISYKSIIDPENANNPYFSEIIERDNPTNEALEYIAHEVGHNVHFNIATHGDLVGWMSAIRSEQKFPTKYGELIYKVDNQAGQREDFAESFKLYVIDPKSFATDFPKRFDYMQKLFNKYTQQTT